MSTKTWNTEHRILREKLTRRYDVLNETKDHLINRLTALSNEEKQMVAAFFHKHPEAENRIDWNKKDLVFADFKKLMDFEGIGKTAMNKAGLRGLEKGVDYDIMDTKPGYTVYIPYTYDASRVIASNSVKPVLGNGAKWCTAKGNTNSYWYGYTDERKSILVYICDENSNEKWAIEFKNYDTPVAWDWKDLPQDIPEKFEYIVDWVNDNRDELRASIDNGNEVQKARDLEKEERWLKNPIAVVDNEGVCLGLPTYVIREHVKEVSVPASTKTIDAYAFSFCSSLERIKLPFGLKCIDEYAFYTCRHLTDITIPGSVTSIKDSAFNRCISLTTITIPNSVESLGKDTFRDCHGLKDVELSNGITYIKDSAFQDCSGLTAITIPEGVENLGWNVFEGCTNLKSIEIPDSVQEIGCFAFSYCRNLKSITVSQECHIDRQSDWDGKIIRRETSEERSLNESIDGNDNFRKWFGDSKVVDENGNPLVVYHGTSNTSFKSFAYDPGRQTGSDYGRAYYFTDNEDIASGYGYNAFRDNRLSDIRKIKDGICKEIAYKATHGLDYSAEKAELHRLSDQWYSIFIHGQAGDTEGRILKCYLRMENPYETDANGDYYFNVYPRAFEAARKNGCDGVIIHNVVDVAKRDHIPCTVYVVFDEKQIKSVDNNGDFNRESDNIYEKILKKGNKWQVTDHTGKKNLGTYDTKAEAEERLRQVEYFKHAGN